MSSSPLSATRPRARPIAWPHNSAPSASSRRREDDAPRGTMNTYTLLSGQTVELDDPPPAVAAFLARAQAALADPNVSVGQLTNLIYGTENPLLDTTTVPGQAIVNRAAFESPLYHVLTDL